MPHVLPSQPDGQGLRIGVLVTRWYPEVMARLKDAALDTLAAAGVADDDVLVVEVPGAFELPQAAQALARAGWRGRPLDALVALGCVLRGETPHFDHVARAAIDGLLGVAVTLGVPIGMGVITADTRAQVDARSCPSDLEAGSKRGNKGREAADAAVRLAATRRRLAQGAAPGGRS